MKTSTKIILGIVAVVVAGAIYEAYQFPNQTVPLGSAAGSTFNSAKVAGQVITTGTTTAISLLNTDASAREILGVDMKISGATGTSTTYTVACATSTSASSLQGNINSIVSTTLATSTFGSIVGVGTFVASTSPGLTGTTTASTLAGLSNEWVRVWGAGTYLNCQVTTADNYNAFNSTTVGTINFPYRGQ